jgi:ribosome-binding factor A
MREHRDEKAASELRDLMGEFIAREAGRTTLITPSRGEFGRNPKFATIYISVFPAEETEHAIAFLSRNTSEFRDFLKKHGRFSVLPFVKFLPDYGEENRQRLDVLSKEL